MTRTFHWHRLTGIDGRTYFKLFEEDKGGADHTALVERVQGVWRYGFSTACPDLATLWGHTGSPIRSRRLAEEHLYRVLGARGPITITKEIL